MSVQCSVDRRVDSPEKWWAHFGRSSLPFRSDYSARSIIGHLFPRPTPSFQRKTFPKLVEIAIVPTVSANVLRSTPLCSARCPFYRSFTLFSITLLLVFWLRVARTHSEQMCKHIKSVNRMPVFRRFLFILKESEETVVGICATALDTHGAIDIKSGTKKRGREKSSNGGENKKFKINI